VSRLNILLLAVAVIVAVLTILWFYPSVEDFGKDNNSWNGLSEFEQKSGAVSIDSFTELPEGRDDTVLILIPYSAFTAAELDQIKTYVTGGGTLVLLDDYRYGNDVLEILNINYRFSGAPLLDPLANYKNEKFPKILAITAAPLTAGIEMIIFDHASCLLGVPADEIFARSSSFGFVDEDGDSLYDEGEERKGALAVIAHTVLGKGRVVAISDPSIIINGMVEMEDNYAIVENATRLSDLNPRIYLDQSHLEGSAFFNAKSSLRPARDIIAHPAVLFGMVGTTLLLVLKPLRRRRR